ncbi:MAG: sigma-70 family RNA polymerase sigma factor [Pseudomonadota bacterium]
MTDRQSTTSRPSSAARARLNEKFSHLLAKIGSEHSKKDFVPLFEHYAPLIKSYSVRMGLGHRSDEMTQEVMVQVWQKAHKFDPKKASATTWIYTVARNLMIDHLRAKKGDEIPLETDDIWHEDENSEPFVSFQKYAAKKHLEESIQQLPFEQKDLITQIYLAGKTQQQLSDELGIPLGTVKSRIRLALGKLKLSLKKLDL